MTAIDNKVIPLGAAYPFLPARIVDILRLFCLKYPSDAARVTEIRLRRLGALSLSATDKNIFPDECGNISGTRVLCTPEDVDGCCDLLCGSSFHSHRAELECGYISSSGQVRAGVSTYGTLGGAVWGVDAVCIRIPRDITGCSAPLLSLTGVCPTLIYSPPGVGKTTLLRDIIRALSDEYRLRVVVCDTKSELLSASRPNLADYICGKEKAEAIEAATRCMSPQALVCDELGGREETEAILSAQSGGVPLYATAHASDMKSLLSRPNLKLLYEGGVFEKYVGLKREGERFIFDVQNAE